MKHLLYRQKLRQLAALGIGLVSMSATAQFINVQPNNLFEVSSTFNETPSVLTINNVYAEEVYSIDVDGTLLDTLPTTFRFQLETGNALTVRKVSATRNALTGGVTWKGENDHGTSVLATWVDNKLTATVNTQALQRGDADGYYEVIHDVLTGPKLLKLRAAETTGPSSFGNTVTANPVAPLSIPQEMIRIDVLVVYSTAYSDAEREGVISSIMTEEMVANSLLHMNMMNYQLNIVGIEAVTLEPTPSTALGGVMNNQEVLTLRDQTGADMVAMIVPDFDTPQTTTHPSVCGVANLPGISITGEEVFDNNGNLPFNEAAFMAMVLDCGGTDRTFLHELSHNFGMVHEPEDEEDFDDDVTPIRPFAFGSVSSDPMTPASIMECANNGGTSIDEIMRGVCRRNDMFSDGSISDQFNNQQVGIERASVVSGYRDEVGNVDMPPIVNIVFPANNELMFRSNAYFSARALDILDDNVDITWTSNRNGAIGDGETINPAGLFLGEHLITVTATDDAGNIDESVISVEITNVVPQPNFGLWQDSLKAQTFLALHQLPSGESGFFWATYDISGDPIWYLTDLNQMVNGNLNTQFDQTTTVAGLRDRQGDADLRFINQTTAVLDWDFDEGGPGVSFLRHRQGVLNAVSGNYFDPSDSGWGISFFAPIESTILDPGNDIQSLYFAYDNSQPIWLLSGPNSGTGNGTNFTAFVYDYFTEGSCPFCSGQGIGFPEDAGSLGFLFPTGFLGQNTPFNLPNSTWQRTNRTLQKLIN